MNIYFLIFLLMILAVWDGIWKGIAMWRAGRNNQLNWFIPIMMFNTIGILPIIYLKYYQRRRKR